MTGGHNKNLWNPMEINPPRANPGAARRPRRARRGAIPGHHTPVRPRSPAQGAGAGAITAAKHAHSAAAANHRKHCKTKGETACAPSLSQAPWRLLAMGNTTPRRRCFAMRGTQAGSREPHSGAHRISLPQMREKWRESTALYRYHSDM